MEDTRQTEPARNADTVDLAALHKIRSQRTSNVTEQVQPNSDRGTSSLEELRNKSSSGILSNTQEEEKKGPSTERQIPSSSLKSPPAPQQQRQIPQQSVVHEQTNPFECNICLDAATEPVVTPCGHLYCWKCIYEWLKQPRQTLVCPVCKSGVSQDKLIPIFTKANDADPRKRGQGPAEVIPNRPGGQRSEPEPNANFSQGMGSNIFGGVNGSNMFGNQLGGFVMGIGLFPSLFTLNFTWDEIFGPNTAGPGAGGANSGNPEETTEQNLKKLLIAFAFFMLLSFVLFGSDVFIVF